MKVYYVAGFPYSDELFHHQVKGAEWYKRRYQNYDGTYTPLGRIHYGFGDKRDSTPDRYEIDIDHRVKQAIRTGDQSYFSRGGTVNLYKRPVIPSSWLKDMGYDAEPGGTATVFSHSTSIGDRGEHAVTVTPILPNGDVIERDTMEEVLDNLYLGSDGKPHLDGNNWGFNLEDILISHYDVSNIPPGQRSAYINAMSNALHEVQEALYEDSEPIDEPTDDIPSIENKKKVKKGKGFLSKISGMAKLYSLASASASIINSGLSFIKKLFSK